MRLQLDGAFVDQGFALLDGGLAIPEIIQRGLVDDQLVVQDNGHDVADHGDVEGVPLADRLIRKH